MSLPYLPPGREILYVAADNLFMQEAIQAAKELSKDPEHPIGAVLVLNEKVVARGANGSDHHIRFGCERKKRNIPTGEQYELCPGCDPKNHAEQTLLREAEGIGINPAGGDIYLYGHWWCCQSCWGKMIEAGIKNVYLVEGAEKIFRR